MSKFEENRKEEMFSFDELKKQVTADEADFTEDAEVQQLLSSLRDIPAPAETQASDSEEENEAPTESEEPDEAQNYKSIYDDVLRAVGRRKRPKHLPHSRPNRKKHRERQNPKSNTEPLMRFSRILF